MSVIGTTPEPRAPGRRSFVPVPALAAALLAALVYLNALDNPFVYDDFRLIVENTSILDVSDVEAVIVRDITRPIVNLSYALDTALYGQSPVGYHITSLVLHLVNVVLVFWVALLAVEDRSRQRGQLLRTGASPTLIAFATAVLFAVHPMMTQAVGYISGRSEVAYTASFLLAFLAGRRWMLDGGRRWWLACVGLWLMAMLTKESAAMLPFVLLAYDWLVLDADWPARQRRFLRLGLPLVSITFLAGAGRLAVLGLIEYPDQAGPDWRFALVAVDAFWRYVGMLALPRDQSIFHAVPLLDSPFAPRALAGLLGLGVLIAAVWWLRQVHSLLAFGLAWFTLLLVPSSVLFVMGMGEPMAEHRIYLSAAGFFLIGGATFGLLWTRARRGRLIVGLAASLFILQLGLQTLVRNAVWQDPIGLSREAAALAPDHWMPRVLFGEALRQNGRCDAAIPEYRAAIAMRPAEEFPYTKLAGCLIEGRRLAEAEGALQQLRAVNPTSEEALMGLSVLAVAHGRKGEAGAYLRETLRQAPDHQQARLLLAFLDDALPAGERVRLCQDLKMLTGDPPPYEGCV